MQSKSKFWLLGVLSVLVVGSVFFLRPVAQSQAYHHFADTRGLWGIPNFANVVSNLPFLFVGVAGWMVVHRSAAPRGWMYAVLFAGVFLTGLGSAYYHWHPCDRTLVWDRIPMTIVFMSLLSATVGELVSSRWGRRMFWPLAAVGVFSVWWWQFSGDLRWYGLVQFYPVLFIPLLLWLFYSPDQRGAIGSLGWVVVWYLVAKGFEFWDKPVFDVIGVSGHTLKHLAAAVSTGYLVQMFRRKYVG